jgi:O-antigen ligase
MYRPITLHLQRVSRSEISGKLATFVAIAVVAGLLIILPFPLDAALIVVPLGGVLAFTAPFLLPLALIASVPVQDLMPLPADVPLTATRAAIAGGLAIAPLVIIAKSFPIRYSRLMLVVIVYLALMVASLLNATSSSPGYAEMYRWVVALFAFWLVVQFIRTHRHVIALAAVIAAAALAQGALGAAQTLLGWGPESFDIGLGYTRAYGTIGMPNSYAAYMEAVTIPLIPLVLWSLARTRACLADYRLKRLQGFLISKEPRSNLVMSIFLTALLSAGLLFGLTGIALSFSRGGWLGTIAALGVVVVLVGRRAIMTTAMAGALAMILMLLGASGTVIGIVEDRLSQLMDQVRIGDIRGVPVTEENFATIERIAHWQTAIAMWSDHPWLGIGIGNFDERYFEYAVHPLFLDSQGHAHNYYLHVMAETGLLGLSAYLVLLIGAVVLGWRAYRSDDSLARALGIGVIGLTVALAVHNLFENLHVLNITVQIFAVWALAVVAIRWTENAQSSADGASRMNHKRPGHRLTNDRSHPR